MGSDHERHHRRSVRLPGHDYSRAGAYFLTVCVQNRECLFGVVADDEMRMNRFGEIADECWRAIPEHFENVELDAFVVMPNHVHGIIIINIRDGNVGATHASPLRWLSARLSDERRPPISAPPTITNGPKPRSIGAITGSFKSAAAKRINELRNTPGAPVWQRNYYEHIIRDEIDLDRVRKYIEKNPAQWAEDQENLHGQTKDR